MSPRPLAAPVSPVPRPVWRAVLAADPDAVPTQTPEWLDALCRHTGMVDASRLYELPGGRRVVVPLAARVVGGIRVTEESWPYGWGYGGALVAGGGLGPGEADAILSDLLRRARVRTTVVPAPTAAAAWERAAGPARSTRLVPYSSQLVDLTGGPASVTARFSKSLRYSIRKAARLGVEVRRDTTGAHLADFARLYEDSQLRWAQERGQPRPVARTLARLRDRPGQVARVADALGPDCAVWVATWRGEPVEVAVRLYHGRFVHGWLAANDRRLVRETRGGTLLTATVLEDACERGASTFLFGESDPGSAVEEYKRQFGASTLRHSAVRLEPVPLTATAATLRRGAEAALRRRLQPPTPEAADA